MKWVSSLAFSPDGQQLASGSESGTVRLWDVRTGEQVWSLEGYASGVKSVAFSPDGQLLALGSSDGTVILWRVR
jgi:WD40 repeat protein